MSNYKRPFLTAILCTMLMCSATLAGNYTVPITIEISSTAINRYLNTQYNSTGFPRSIPVSYGGVNYTTALTLPQVILTPGNAKLQMIFDVNTTSGNVYHFEVDPSINIPSGQISLSQVQAFLTDLVVQLNNVPNVPQWVKDAVTQNYNSLGFNVYPSKLIDQINTTSFAEQSINIVSPPFALGWEVGQDALDLIVSTNFEAKHPMFVIDITKESNGHNHFKTGLAFVRDTVKYVAVYNSLFTQKYYDSGEIKIPCEKGNAIDFDMGDIGYSAGDIAGVYVIYSSGNTWYSGKYKIAVGKTYFDANDKNNF